MEITTEVPRKPENEVIKSISCLNMYLKDSRSPNIRETCTYMFIAVVFTMNGHKCMLYMHNIVLYSCKDMSCPFKKLNRNGAHHVKGNKPDSEKQTSHILSDIQNLYTKKGDITAKGTIREEPMRM